MLLDQMFIRDDKVILHDISGEEVELWAEDALGIMDWCYEHHNELHSLTMHKSPIQALPRVPVRLPRKEGE